VTQALDGSAAAVRVAAVQLSANADRASNLAAADALVREAAGGGARLVVLPEKWPLYASGAEMSAAAESLDGPVVSWARAAAAELGIDLVAGSYSERGEDGAVHNTSLHISPRGEIRALYRKIHMFDVTIDGVDYRESEHETPGDEIVTSETDDGVALGLSICYDLRFPELYRILALRGARILLVPAAFTFATTRDHWGVLLRARAIENQAFVVAANQIGEFVPGRVGGRSMIVDPWGVVLAQAQDEAGVIVAELDLARLERIRGSLPSLANRRPSAYRWPQ
jgi:predicted amidohydrolase